MEPPPADLSGHWSDNPAQGPTAFRSVDHYLELSRARRHKRIDRDIERMTRIDLETYHQTRDSILPLSRNRLQVTPNSVKPAGAAPRLSLPLGPKSEAPSSATDNNPGAGTGEIPPEANPPPLSHPKKPYLHRTHLQNAPAASQPTFITPPHLSPKPPAAAQPTFIAPPLTAGQPHLQRPKKTPNATPSSARSAKVATTAVAAYTIAQEGGSETQ